MKKINYLIYIFLIFFIVSSCSEKKATHLKEDTQKHIKALEKHRGRVVYDYGWASKVIVFQVDSCEYIGFDGGTDGGKSIIHKHNCKFCMRRNNE